MNLAINYSPAAARLIQSGDIEVDYFKTPDWEWIVRKAQELKPVIVHFTLEAGNGSLAEVNWPKIRQLAEMTHTPYINLHLDARQSYYPDLEVETIEEASVNRIFNVIQSDVTTAVEQFGQQRVIVDNSPYPRLEGNTFRLCVDPDVISRCLEVTGCGLLLDISHAVIAAKSLGLTPESYISRLPLHMVKELHFAGIHQDRISGRYVDHLSIQEQDWYWLELVFDHLRSVGVNSPWILVFEYGGVGESFAWRTDPSVIAEQVPRLLEKIRGMTW